MVKHHLKVLFVHVLINVPTYILYYYQRYRTIYVYCTTNCTYTCYELGTESLSHVQSLNEISMTMYDQIRFTHIYRISSTESANAIVLLQ